MARRESHIVAVRTARTIGITVRFKNKNNDVEMTRQVESRITDELGKNTTLLSLHQGG